MCAEYLDFLPAASEDEGVTAFEAGNDSFPASPFSARSSLISCCFMV